MVAHGGEIGSQQQFRNVVGQDAVDLFANATVETVQTGFYPQCGMGSLDAASAPANVESSREGP